MDILKVQNSSLQKWSKAAIGIWYSYVNSFTFLWCFQGATWLAGTRTCLPPVVPSWHIKVGRSNKTPLAKSHKLFTSKYDQENIDLCPFCILREAAVSTLGEQETGAFIIRKSTSRPGAFAMALKAPKSKKQTSSCVTHYLIKTREDGVYLNVS